MPWQKQNPELYKAEISAIRRRFPDVSIEEKEGRIHLKGLFPVRTNSGSTLQQFRLHVVFPQNYPEWIPDSFMLEPNIERIAERHIEKNGRACLCLPHKILSILKGEIRFEAYFDHLLTPWLIGQVYYNKYDCWPWPTRNHGKEGILQGLSDFLNIKDLKIVERYVKLLVRKNPAKGHELCPCGSGRKLRNCHSDLYHQCRECLPNEAINIYRNLIFVRYK